MPSTFTNVVVIDFETYYDTKYTLTKLRTRDYIADPRFEVIGMSLKRSLTKPAEWFTGPEVGDALACVDIASSLVLAHNCRFDAAILRWHYGLTPRGYLDTAAMARATLRGREPRGSVSLAAIAALLGLQAKGTAVHENKGKRLRDFSPADLSAYGAYARNDAELCAQIFTRLLPEMVPAEMRVIDATLRMYLHPSLQLDPDALSSALKQARADRAQIINRTGLPVEEIRSREQFAVHVQANGGQVPLKVSPRTGAMTYALAKTDEGFIELLNSPIPEVRALAEARLAASSNIEITRMERLLDIARDHGTLAVPIVYWGASTGRDSGDEKINMQNIPRESPMRAAVRAPEGHVVCAVDAAQIEARVLSWLADEKQLLTWFGQGRDVYSEYASRLYGVEVTKSTHPIERFVGKTAVLGLGYGAGVLRFKKMLKDAHLEGTDEELLSLAEKTVDNYRSTFPKIRRLWREAQDWVTTMNREEMLKDAYGSDSIGILISGSGDAPFIALPNGMKLFYADLNKEGRGEYTYRYGNKIRKVYGALLVENYVQAVSRIITFGHMLKIRDITKRFPALRVHDELVYVIPEQEEEEFVRIVSEVLRTPPSWAPSLPLDCEVGVGYSYSEAK